MGAVLGGEGVWVRRFMHEHSASHLSRDALELNFHHQPLSPFHSRSGQSPEQLSDKQLLVVPMMVVVLRSWGTVYTLSSLISTDANIVCDDPNDIMRSLFSILGILQVRV